MYCVSPEDIYVLILGNCEYDCSQCKGILRCGNGIKIANEATLKCKEITWNIWIDPM